MRAVQMGVPVLASDLPALRELTDSPGTLLPRGRGGERGHRGFPPGRDGVSLPQGADSHGGEMVSRVEEAYCDVAHSRASTPVKPAREQ